MQDFFGLTSDPFALAMGCPIIGVAATAATPGLGRFQEERGTVERKLLSDVITHVSSSRAQTWQVKVSMNDTEQKITYIFHELFPFPFSTS